MTKEECLQKQVKLIDLIIDELNNFNYQKIHTTTAIKFKDVDSQWVPAVILGTLRDVLNELVTITQEASDKGDDVDRKRCFRHWTELGVIKEDIYNDHCGLPHWLWFYGNEFYDERYCIENDYEDDILLHITPTFLEIFQSFARRYYAFAYNERKEFDVLTRDKFIKTLREIQHKIMEDLKSDYTISKKRN